MLKFNMYNITDTETGLKVKVRYHAGTGYNQVKKVFITEENYGDNLSKLFNSARNNTDITTDYVEYSHMDLSEGDQYFDDVTDVINRLEAARIARRQKKAA